MHVVGVLVIFISISFLIISAKETESDSAEDIYHAFVRKLDKYESYFISASLRRIWMAVRWLFYEKFFLPLKHFFTNILGSLISKNDTIIEVSPEPNEDDEGCQTSTKESIPDQNQGHQMTTEDLLTTQKMQGSQMTTKGLVTIDKTQGHQMSTKGLVTTQKTHTNRMTSKDLVTQAPQITTKSLVINVKTETNPEILAATTTVSPCRLVNGKMLCSFRTDSPDGKYSR